MGGADRDASAHGVDGRRPVLMRVQIWLGPSEAGAPRNSIEQLPCVDEGNHGDSHACGGFAGHQVVAELMQSQFEQHRIELCRMAR